MAAEFLVVGLGNPGEEYRFTPHNMGFLVIDRLAESNAIRVTRKENTSLVGLGTVKGREVALAQPQTYMNLSGPAVKGLLDQRLARTKNIQELLGKISPAHRPKTTSDPTSHYRYVMMFLHTLESLKMDVV